jgi:signal transduction histidine kinase
MRHSDAATVEISLGLRSPNEFALTLSDDGIGTAGEREGMGMRNMRERARQLPGGRFMLASDGRGTEIQVIWSTCETIAWRAA